MRSITIFTAHKNNSDNPIKNNETGERILHVWGRGELDAGFSCRNLREGNSLED